ncbi:MAG: AAA family ATPase, partial [Propionibacteriaceae bacterium]|nr:AAA family ATPase [Propionibacteriaceae bacterium]
MTKTVYLMATADNPHLTAIAAALVDQLLRQSVKVGLFWPIRPAADQTMTDLLARAGANQPLETAIGASYNQVHQDLDQAMMAMIGKLTDLQASVDLVVCVGSDYSDLIAPMEFSINAKIAANLDAPVLLIITDPAQSPSDLPAQARLYVDALREKYATCMGLIVPSGSADQAHWPKPLSLVEAVDFGHTPLSISPQAASTIVAADLPGVRTPLRFQFELARRARADLRTIILPEAEDDRILKAASEIIDRGLAHLILLGDPAVVAAQAKVLGVDLTGARIQDPTDPKL